MFQPLRDADEAAEVPSGGEEDHRLRSGAEDDQTGADRKELSREREGKNVKNVVKGEKRSGMHGESRVWRDAQAVIFLALVVDVSLFDTRGKRRYSTEYVYLVEFIR